ncbi:hypothetical protein EU527_16450 [Candidatus Thorarchaeota archaeon]|nr:MAG: hypothetical protein EU527_16450 [Candidatus Thorarchaeota archaeon]
MNVIWGTKKWQFISAILIIFIFGYGTYTILMDIIAGHPIWWYNASFILFALTILGLLLLVRQGWATLRNIVTYGFNPSSIELHTEEDTDIASEPIDNIDADDNEIWEDRD